MPATPTHHDTVTARVADDEGNPRLGGRRRHGGLRGRAPSISTLKTPSAGTVPEPGATVTFTVAVANTSVEAVTLGSLVDDVFGDLRFARQPGGVGQHLPGAAGGDPGGRHLRLLVRGLRGGRCRRPGPSQHGDGDGDRRRRQPGVGRRRRRRWPSRTWLPSIAVAKTPSAGTVPEPGGTVTFTVTVANTSVEPVTLIALADSVFGNLLDPANPAVSANTCPARPAVIGVGGTFSCSFDAFVAGDVGDPAHRDTVTAAVIDDEGTPALGRRRRHGGLRGSWRPPSTWPRPPIGASVPEPGGTVTFTVTVANTSVEPVTLIFLADDVFGDLLRPGEPGGVEQHLPGPAGGDPGGRDLLVLLPRPGGRGVRGPGPRQHGDGGGRRRRGQPRPPATTTPRWPSGTVCPTIDVAKQAAPGTVPEPGAMVLFGVTVRNTVRRSGHPHRPHRLGVRGPAGPRRTRRCRPTPARRSRRPSRWAAPSPAPSRPWSPATPGTRTMWTR